MWRNEEEPCNQKLPFEYWVYMKAVGTEQDFDAYHVRNECLKPRAIGVVELVTPEVSRQLHNTSLTNLSFVAFLWLASRVYKHTAQKPGTERLLLYPDDRRPKTKETYATNMPPI